MPSDMESVGIGRSVVFDELESFCKAPREQVAQAMRSLAAMRSMITVDPALLLRAIGVYEIDRRSDTGAVLKRPV
ncbi:MAG: hypothetical protein ABI862_10915 [Ilumatobacteraceae bacterium]